ncbi:Ger(x)C family spore germination protein [Bacillus dakarensis]|uniref:Ger(x)C family spore germination protein n=1 Tax=Robertmurraya dakarensis TaxID=1926278 RepID=UPI000980E6F0|nr:Ger(x)C family spore germination protein [Bacillus dakarensis]
MSVICTGRRLMAIIVSLSLILQSGCGFKDIDKRVFVLSIGVDHTDNEERPYKVILKLAIPTGSLRESGTEFTYLTKESESIASAIRLLKTHADKELDFGHAKVIVFGEDLLHHDLTEIADFFVRRRDIQRVSWVAVGSPNAEGVLKTQPSSEKAGSALFNLFDQNGVESAYIVSTYLFDFRRRMIETGFDPILPVLSSSNDKKKIVVNSSILFAKNKHPFKLSPRETKFYNLLANNTQKLDLIVNRDDLIYTIAVDTAKTKYKLVTNTKNKPGIKLDVSVKGIIEESNKQMDPSQLSTYSKYASEMAKKEITELLKKLQEYDADPIGFGLRYKATRLHTRDTFKEWEELYPELAFDVNVNVSIMSTGIIE